MSPSIAGPSESPSLSPSTSPSVATSPSASISPSVSPSTEVIVFSASQSASQSVSPSKEALPGIPFPILPPELTEKPVLYKNHQIMNKEISQAKNNQSRIPSWNNLGRPKNPRTGTIGFNFEIQTLEYWTGTSWLKLIMKKL